MEDLVSPTALTEVARSLRSGETDVQDHTERTLARIERVDPTVQAFVEEPGRSDRLRSAAKDLAATEGERPALFGVPVGVKDIIHADGLETRAGSRFTAQELAGPQATAIERLRTAGALIAGKTVTSEFAVTAPGPTRNPHNLDHTPGGSSSGSAAAVAAGLVPLAIGTQTIGSLIRPAAYCGVTGFKPTHGRIPLDGVLPTAPTFDTVGMIAARAADVSLAASVLLDDWTPVADDGTRPVLGVPDGPYLGCAEPAALAAFEEQTAALTAAGYQVVRVPLFENFEQEAFEFIVINLYEISRAHADRFAADPERYDPRTAEAIQHGQGAGDGDHAASLEQREAFRGRLDAATAEHGVDLWITPAATGTAPEGLENPGESVMSLPWSGLGLPCLTLPVARAAGELPLGFQGVGKTGADERLLAWAPGLERILSAR